MVNGTPFKSLMLKVYIFLYGKYTARFVLSLSKEQDQNSKCQSEMRKRSSVYLQNQSININSVWYFTLAKRAMLNIPLSSNMEQKVDKKLFLLIVFFCAEHKTMYLFLPPDTS